MLKYTGALLGLLSLCTAAPIFELEERATDQPGCTSFRFPVTASATNLKLANIPPNLDNPTVLEDFIVSSASAIAGGILANAGATETKNGTFNMAAIYCEPLKSVKSREMTIQYLQHAITMRKEYWNGLTYPVGYQGTTYSYMQAARQEGYHTIAIDNLGAGSSDHPDPIAVTQQTLQVEVIHQILLKLKAGTVGGPVKQKFDKIIYAGHSYGSICGNGIATHHPTDVDAFIFTGYTGEFALGAGPLAAGVLAPAAVVMPTRYGSLAPGYLAMSLEQGRAYGLYTNPATLGGFDNALPPDDYKNEGTGAIGEVATLLYGVGPADQYKGHVLVITGKNDAIACNSAPAPDCGSGDTSLPAQAGAFFPAAADYTYHIPDTTGHNVNLHYTAQDSFKFAINYLASKGF